MPVGALRADARRSREAIVAAYSVLATERGADVPMYEVAARAGVGQGTLYRHFANRTVLLAAVFEEEIAELERLADARPDDPTLLLDLLSDVTRSQARLHGLNEALLAAHDAGPELQRLAARTAALLERPLAEAAAAGIVRPEITIADVVAVMSMTEGMLIGLVDADERIAAVERGMRLLSGGLLAPDRHHLAG